jgi:hypothetical protein
MKRADMLSKIASVIINYNEAHCIINRDKAMEIAETILQIQKEVGMLPPPTQKTTLGQWEPEE